jgi:uncharacterized membrane protein YdjX (TVP38/TMEM64 family)
MKNKKVLLILLALLIVLFFVFDLSRFFNFDYLKSQQAALEARYQANPATTLIGFFLIYIAVTALSLPGAAILTLAAGALFGLVTGTVLASFASSIGATLAFLASRFICRDMIEQKFGERLKTFNENIDRDGAFYLFTLRLVPIFPFFIINLVMGLTRLKTWVFYVVSQIGMLAGTIVYVNAGTQLASIESPAGIISPALLFSFALLGVFPLVAKKVVDVIKARKVYKDYPRPQRFDRDIVVVELAREVWSVRI